MVPHWISQTLDLGAQGIMVPRVESRETVEAALRRMKYPPLGERGLALGAQIDYLPASPAAAVEHQNQNTMLVIQIESELAVDRVDEIVSVPGLDAVMMGPMDLSLSLGVVGEVDHPKMRAAMARVIEACNRHGVACGMHMGDLDLLRHWRDQGARFLTYGGEMGFIKAGLDAGIRALRG
jgi:2-dehydro-3-deoxyglucarate aldolase/4-hydroxy-2-oxoheptanedioate aldolase